MRFSMWIGIAMVVYWAILWLGIKIAVDAIHTLLLLGLVLIAWALFRRGSARSSV